VQLGSIACFAFLMAGASRLARFNIAKNPQPSNPGRPGKRYFVGMPIPAGAGVVAAIVHYSAGAPVTSWWTAMSWLMMVVVVGYLMVSTWRFYSFKDIDFRSRRPFRLIVVIAVVVASIALFSRPALFAIAILYMASGVLWRLQWIFHRKSRPPAPPVQREASHTP
jgi:CDP-diacylglycerol--serine O-phosphatidyltransferase